MFDSKRSLGRPKTVGNPCGFEQDTIYLARAPYTQTGLGSFGERVGEPYNSLLAAFKQVRKIPKYFSNVVY